MHKAARKGTCKEVKLLLTMREYLNLTKKQAAEKAGIPLSTYQKFENSERNIRTASFTTTCKVLQALELDPYDFFLELYEFKDVHMECPVVKCSK